MRARLIRSAFAATCPLGFVKKPPRRELVCSLGEKASQSKAFSKAPIRYARADRADVHADGVEISAEGVLCYLSPPCAGAG